MLSVRRHIPQHVAARHRWDDKQLHSPLSLDADVEGA
jgi:hypothetical protein